MNLRRFAAFVALILAALLSTPAPAPAQTSEELVKATFLYRFVSFVTWPPASFSDPNAAIRLCVIGAPPFARTLAQAVEGQRVDNRTFEVRQLADLEEAPHCHVLYVAGERTDEALRELRGTPVLTITDGSLGGAHTRGVIHFAIVEDRVRFHIDDALAAQGGLTLSSRLLALAVSVRRRASA